MTILFGILIFLNLFGGIFLLLSGSFWEGILFLINSLFLLYILSGAKTAFENANKIKEIEQNQKNNEKKLNFALEKIGYSFKELEKDEAKAKKENTVLQLSFGDKVILKQDLQIGKRHFEKGKVGIIKGFNVEYVYVSFDSKSSQLIYNDLLENYYKTINTD